jgi:radical SAM superfamily enzyme YgiQ (UPF0313 family)
MPEKNLVCLVNPSSQITYGVMEAPAFPPLGIEYVAAVLEEAGFGVKIIDMDAEKLSLQGLKQRFAELNPFLVGITCTTPLFKQAIQIAGIAKQACGAKTCLGGIHPTISPMDAINPNEIDFVVYGEGEITTRELAKTLSKKRTGFQGIEGLVFKVEGTPVKNKPRALIKDLDKLPFPARHLLNQLAYTYPDALKSPAIGVMTSRGCPGQCTYCCTKCIFGLSYRFRSADNVIAEIEHLVEKYSAKEIHIWDDNFTVNKKRVFEFCDKVKAKKLHEKVLFSVPQGLRVDHVDEDILKALKSINIYSVGYGIESGNDHILKLCKKNVTRETARKAVEMSKRLGFDVWCFFILGLYGDTEQTIRETIDFAKDLNPTFAKFLILKPFPGTEVFEQLDERGLIVERDYEKFGLYAKPIHRLPGISPERLVQLQNQAYREFYLRPKKIAEQLARLKSLHRLKLNISAGLSILKLALARQEY